MTHSSAKRLAWFLCPTALLAAVVLAPWENLLPEPDFPLAQVREPATAKVEQEEDQLTSLVSEPLEEKAPIPILQEEEPLQAYDMVPNPDLDIVVSENRRLADANRKLNTQLVDTLNWILENFKGKEHIPAHLAAHLRLAGIGEDFLLHDQVMEYLDVSPHEEELVNGALVASRDIMYSIEDQLLTMSSPDPDRIVLRIPPYPEEGAVIRDELYNALEYALGENRLHRLLGVSQEDIESNFHLFGNAARTITFKHEYYENDPYPQLVIHDAWITSDEENRRHVQATSEAVAVVPDDYINYVPWLPADFWVPLDPAQ